MRSLSSADVPGPVSAPDVPVSLQSRDAHVALASQDVHVSLLRVTEQNAAYVVASEHLLDAEERARARRFHFRQDRVLYVAAHGLLRRVLAAYTGTPPSKLAFRRTATGRPELAFPRHSELRFSISHTRGLVGCAITRVCDIGFDLELERTPAPLSIAERFFSPSEQDTLRALPRADQHPHFFALWTLKEAYIKARGLGLHLPLRSFAIEPAPSAELELWHTREAPGYALHSWRTGKHHAALCIASPSAVR